MHRKTKNDISTVWMDLEILETTSHFSYEGSLNRAFGDVRPFFTRGC